VTRTTIRDVAKEAGVSISVVSYVLNDNPNVSISRETRERVLAAAKKLNYTPNRIAQSMRTQKSRVLGLATFWDISDSVFTDILKGIDSVAEKHGYAVTYCHIKNTSSADKVIDLYNQRQIDGVIFLLHVDAAKNFTEKNFLKKIKTQQIPAVIINGSTQDEDLSYVYIDYYNTSSVAVEYLYSLGHRKLAYMLPDKDEVNRRQAVQRINGFKAALTDLGLDQYAPFYFDQDTVGELIKILREEDVERKPTAIVAHKTNYAAFLLKALLEAGVKVPDDVSVIALNDNYIADYLTPPLTSVRVPTYSIGQKSAELLFDILKGKILNEKLKLPNKVVERQSCRPLV